MADLLQLHNAVRDLRPWIEAIPRGPASRRLLPRIRLGGIVGDAAGTIRALPVGAVVRRGHHRHGGHTADGARRLLYEKRQKKIPVRRCHARQYIGIRRHRVQRILLAKPELQILERIPAADRAVFDRRYQVCGQEIQRISHREPCRRIPSSAPREPHGPEPSPRWPMN